jgi:hypothetical protein
MKSTLVTHGHTGYSQRRELLAFLKRRPKRIQKALSHRNQGRTDHYLWLIIATPSTNSYYSPN